MLPDSPLWSEKYRPETIKEIVMPKEAKAMLQAMVDAKEIPVNLLFSGGAGTGKTTSALALVKEIGADAYKINASLEGNIDKIRTDIMDFASSVSFSGGRKFVILDEADGLTRAAQPALRAFMEDYSVNCGFILTANFVENILEPIRSRCRHISFAVSQDEAPELMSRAFKRVCGILKNENVTFDPKVVAQVIEKHFPDLRKVLNVLQPYARMGGITAGVLATGADVDLEELVQAVKGRNFTLARKWVAEYSGEYDSVYRAFYDAANQYILPASIPQLVVLIAKYQHMGASCADPEVNMSAFMAEVMALVEFKP